MPSPNFGFAASDNTRNTPRFIPGFEVPALQQTNDILLTPTAKSNTSSSKKPNGWSDADYKKWTSVANQYGFSSIDEVKEFLRKNGLTVDGKLGRNLISKLKPSQQVQAAQTAAQLKSKLQSASRQPSQDNSTGGFPVFLAHTPSGFLPIDIENSPTGNYEDDMYLYNVKRFGDTIGMPNDMTDEEILALRDEIEKQLQSKRYQEELQKSYDEATSKSRKNKLISTAERFGKNLSPYLINPLLGYLLSNVENLATASPATALGLNYVKGKVLNAVPWLDAITPTNYEMSTYYNNNINDIGTDIAYWNFENAIPNIQYMINAPSTSPESRKRLQTLKANIEQSGGLYNYLKAHPGEKVVFGANFTNYKNSNRHRFAETVADKYANFGENNYMNYAMWTPLGQTETMFGNMVSSYYYDPVTGRIVPALSDEYDFNPRPAGGEASAIAKAREVAGNNEAIGENNKYKTTYRFSNIPEIVYDEENNTVYNPRYLTKEGFGIPREQNTIIDDAGAAVLDYIMQSHIKDE